MSTLRVKGIEIKFHKATTSPSLGARTVLTNSHWEYVDLWLRRHHHAASLFYWQQAQTFAKAAEGMPLNSAPLLLYYSFMNAAKALLSAKNIPFSEMHGVKSHNMRGSHSKITLSNEGVRLMNNGIAASLSQYLGESEPNRDHSLEDLLFNLPCIHRTFCLTYKSQKDAFIPLVNCHIKYDVKSGSAYLSAELSKDFIGSKFINSLPPEIIPDPDYSDKKTIRSVDSRPVSGKNLTNLTEIASVSDLLKSLRSEVHYIAGSETLWYAKALVNGPRRLKRSPLTCTLMAMHRLSEICRYKPMQLTKFLVGQKNWLISEFIRMAPPQFLDEISAEITGHQFMIPNTRPAR